MAYVGDWNNHEDLNPHILDWRIEDRDIDKSDQVKWRLDFSGCCDVVFISDPAPELPRALHWAVWAPPLADQLCWGPGHPHPQGRGEHHYYRHALYLSGSAQEFQMVSEHRTCLLPAELWCLSSRAVNTFSQHGADTSMREVMHQYFTWLLINVSFSNYPRLNIF